MTPTRSKAPSSKAKRPSAAKAAPRKKTAPRKAAPPTTPVAKTAAAKKAAGSRAGTAAAKKSSPISRTEQIVSTVEAALADLKAVNIKVLDVRGLTDIADVMIVASGNSDRHVRSIADRVVEFSKKAGLRPTGLEGERDGEWVLVDLQDVIVHIMLPRVREFYRLESLWDVSAAARQEREAVNE
jgi:ribosome-associated protein